MIAINPKLDGADVAAGFFNVGIDAVFDNAGDPVAIEFADAEAVPEPDTALLAMLALSALLATRRGRR